jgi:hypothetical protein
MRSTIFGRKKIKYNLYFKTKSASDSFSLTFPKYTKTVNRVVYIKFVGMTSGHTYYSGLHADTQTFDLSYNTINEEIGYYISVNEFYTHYIELSNKGITYIDFSLIVLTWTSAQQLQNNDIRTVKYGDYHKDSGLGGFNFNNNVNFTKDLLPPDTLGPTGIKGLSLYNTKVCEMTEVLARYQKLESLYIGNTTDNFDFTVPITHPKLVRLDLEYVVQNIPNLTFKNCPSFKLLTAIEPKIYNLNIENCPVFESINGWGNRRFSDINRIGNSKFTGLSVTGNMFSSAVKDKIIDYCVSDGVLNGVLYMGLTNNAPTNTAGVALLQSRGWKVS